MASRAAGTLRYNDATLPLTMFGRPVVQPYAQVTMIDAGKGDCYVVDPCIVELNAQGKYPTTSPSYSRFLIDTGPSLRPGTLNMMVQVLKQYGQPAVTATDTTGTSWAEEGDLAVVKLIEASHMDDDHIGNVVNLINQIRLDATLQASFAQTVALYHELPSLKPDMIIRLLGAPGAQRFVCAAPPPPPPPAPPPLSTETWVSRMKAAGFEVFYKWTIQPLATVDSAIPAIDSAPFLSGSTLPKAKRDRFPPLAAGPLSIAFRDMPPGNTFCVVRCAIRLRIDRKLRKGKVSRRVFVDIEDPSIRSAFVIVDVFEVVFPSRPLPASVGTVRPPRFPRTLPLMSLRQLLQVRNSIESLNRNLPGLISPLHYLPIRGSYTIGQTPFFQFNVMGPSMNLYNELIAESMIELYKAPNSTDPETPKDNDIRNRSSIISLFSRLGRIPGAPPFEMLFTGDAYDRDCTVRETIQAFFGQPYRTNCAVLKVPHHGSDKTASASFYEAVRAQVYLISAQQTSHGSPGLSSLQAIAASAQTDASALAVPTLLFFSDPGCANNIAGSRSNVKRLLVGHLAPNTVAAPGKPIRNYRCYRLRSDPTGFQKSAGRILFGADSTGALAVQFSVAANDSDTTKDWIFLDPATI